MPDGSDSPEMIIGETHFRPKETPSQPNQELQPEEANQRVGFSLKTLVNRTIEGIKPPPPVPVEQIDQEKIARAIRNYRITTTRFKDRNPEMEGLPFTVPDLLEQLNYPANWGKGTNWKDKFPEAYNAVRIQADELQRQGLLEPSEGYTNDPNKEIVAWTITKPEAIIELAKPPQK
jgi:hypothetical protein